VFRAGRCGREAARWGMAQKLTTNSGTSASTQHQHQHQHQHPHTHQRQRMRDKPHCAASRRPEPAAVLAGPAPAQPAGDQNQRRCLRDQPQHSQQETRTSGGACGTGPSTASRYRRGYRGTLGPIERWPRTEQRSRGTNHGRGAQAWGVGSHGLHNKEERDRGQIWVPRPRVAGVGGWLPRPAQQRRARPWTNLGSTTAGCRRGGLAPTACTTNQPPLPQTWPTGPDRRWRLTNEVRAHTHHSKPAIGYRPTGSRLGGCARCVVVLFRHLCFIS
jgi:hypothetical protein